MDDAADCAMENVEDCARDEALEDGVAPDSVHIFRHSSFEEKHSMSAMPVEATSKAQSSPFVSLQQNWKTMSQTPPLVHAVSSSSHVSGGHSHSPTSAVMS